MPHLHLPAAHQAEDLVLAHRIAEAVGSSELYVVWSHAAGPGQRPEVCAHVREEPSSVVEVLANVLGWVSTALEVIFPPRRQAAAPAPAVEQAPVRPRLAPPGTAT
jgi:hypothetical protein